MAQPDAYNRRKDFTANDGDETDHSALNTELDNAGRSINQIRDNLRKIQNDDGGLANQSVGADQLKPEAFEAFRGGLDDAVRDAQAASAESTRSAVASGQSSEAAAGYEAGAQRAATNAAASASASAGAAQYFLNGIYLGAQDADPTVDGNGNPLTDGDFYYNTGNKQWRAWDAATGVWVGSLSTGKFQRIVYKNGVNFEAGVTERLTIAGYPEVKNNVFITFDGIDQHPNTYSLVGSDIVFSAPIPLGVDEVQFSYLESVIYPSSRALLEYSNKSSATAAVRALDDGQLLFVTSDSSRAGLRTRYKVSSGALVFDGYESKQIYYRPIVKEYGDAPCFYKTATRSIYIKAGTHIWAGDRYVSFTQDTVAISRSGGAVTYNLGEDWCLILNTVTGVVSIDLDKFESPAVIGANERKIGGFHYFALSTETLAGLGAPTAVNQYGQAVWTEAELQSVRAMNDFSFWDLTYRPDCDPRGMVCVAGKFWLDSYLCNPDHLTYGTSRRGRAVASGTVLPQAVPYYYGADSGGKYPQLYFAFAAQIAVHHKKRLLTPSEFIISAAGVPIGTSLAELPRPTVTVPVATVVKYTTSKWGVAQAIRQQYVYVDALARNMDQAIDYASHTMSGGTTDPMINAVLMGGADGAGIYASYISTMTVPAAACGQFINATNKHALSMRFACDFAKV